MKVFSLLIFVFFLSGCSTTDYFKYQSSTAVINNLEITEIKNLKKRKHKIKVSFDYEISKFNDVDGLYHCSVQFIVNNDVTMTSHRGSKNPCEINSESGSISINWPTPIDKSLNTPEEILSTINYPLEFFVAIHQDTGKETNRIIGQSAPQKSKI